MNRGTAELIAALTEKGALLERLKSLLQEEQACLVGLDLAGLDQNQQEIVEVMERMAQLTESCQRMIASVGTALGLTGNHTLSPIIEKVGQPESGALRGLQSRIAEQSRSLNGALQLNRDILEDSLKVGAGSLNFFNRMLNPVDTYGQAGSMVSKRGGGRLVCKEI